jgi:hypothetical protein
MIERIMNAAVNQAAFGGAGSALSVISGGVSRLEQLLARFPHMQNTKLADSFGPLGSMIYWDKIYSRILNTNQQLGISGELGEIIEQNTADAFKAALQYGGSIDDVVNSYRELSELYGRNILLSDDDINNITKLRVAFGEGFEQLFSLSTLVGKSVESTYDLINDTIVQADKAGVVTSNTIKALRDNLSIINRLSFRRGVRALSDMAIFSERTRISIEQTASLAEKLTDPFDGLQNALNISAELMTLGGRFGQEFGDPFQVLFEARNAPEKLQERLFEITRRLATINKVTGEIEINPYSFDQLSVAARSLQVDVKELAEAARVSFKEDYISKLISPSLKARNDFDELLAKISGAAQFKNGQFGVQIGQEFKTVSQIDEQDISKISAINEGAEDVTRDLIDSNRSLGETMRILTEVIMRNLIPDDLYRLADDDIRKILTSIDESVINTEGFQYTTDVLSKLQTEAYDNFSKLFEEGLLSGAWDNLTDLQEAGQEILNAFDPSKSASDLTNMLSDPIKSMHLMSLKGIEFFDSMKSGIETANKIGKATKETGNFFSEMFSIGNSGFATLFTDPIEYFKELGRIAMGEEPTVLKNKRLDVSESTRDAMRRESSGKSLIEFSPIKGNIEVSNPDGSKIDNIEVIYPELKPLILDTLEKEGKDMIYKDIIKGDSKYNSSKSKKGF